MNQPWVYICPLPLERLPHLPPHPTPLGWYRGPVWVSWDMQQNPICYLRWNKKENFGWVLLAYLIQFQKYTLDRSSENLPHPSQSIWPRLPLPLLLLSHFSRVRLCDPIDGSPPGSSFPGILQARTLEWVAISFSNAGKWKVKVKSPSRVWLLATPWTAAHQAPPSMGFSRQEDWSGVPLPSPPLPLPSKKREQCFRTLRLGRSLKTSL